MSSDDTRRPSGTGPPGPSQAGVSIEINLSTDSSEGGPPIEKGTRVGKYLLEEKIGHGGMAEVWRARMGGSDEFDKTFAIKFMHGDLTADPKYAKMFINEARVAQNIPEHANVVSVIEFDRVPATAAPGIAGRYYLIMEWVKGADLARLIRTFARTGRKIPQKIALFVVGEILKGLANIHNARDARSQLIGLVHRDISPQNVLLSYTGGVKISDFGVAKADNAQATKTLRGKFGYFAPETVKGRTQDQRSDQFAVGIILWEMLAGRRLFGGGNDAEILHRVSECQVGDVDREIDPALDGLMRTMLSPDPKDRFASANEALSAVFKIGSYHPDSRDLADVLLYLFPDPEQRLPPPADLPRLLAQPSGTIEHDLGYPVPMEPSISVVIDREKREVLPVWPSFAGRQPFPNVTPNMWARGWQRLGLDRKDELPPGDEPQTRADHGGFDGPDGPKDR